MREEGEGAGGVKRGKRGTDSKGGGKRGSR